jgi:hypothetical protein
MNDSGTPKITVETTGHQKLELDDNGSKIKLTAAGNEVTLDGTPGSSSITVRTMTGTTLTLADTPSGISLSCPTGTFTLTCMQANINATSALMVNAPTTIFSGPVIAPAITTQSVVSPTYTPGVGNTMGL